jgi:hypothetical protein
MGRIGKTYPRQGLPQALPVTMERRSVRGFWLLAAFSLLLLVWPAA